MTNYLFFLLHPKKKSPKQSSQIQLTKIQKMRKSAFISVCANRLFKAILMLFLSFLSINTVFAQNEIVSEMPQNFSETTDSLPPEVAAYVRKILAEEDSLEKLNQDYAPITHATPQAAERPLYYDVSFSACTLSPSAKSAHIHINCLQYMEEVNVLGTDGVKYEVPVVYYPNSTELNTNGLASGEYVILIQMEKSIFSKNIWVK
jgi:hypothetical protein